MKNPRMMTVNQIDKAMGNNLMTRAQLSEEITRNQNLSGFFSNSEIIDSALDPQKSLLKGFVSGFIAMTPIFSAMKAIRVAQQGGNPAPDIAIGAFAMLAIAGYFGRMKIAKNRHVALDRLLDKYPHQMN